jgi:hypothetical protein
MPLTAMAIHGASLGAAGCRTNKIEARSTAIKRAPRLAVRAAADVRSQDCVSSQDQGDGGLAVLQAGSGKRVAVLQATKRAFLDVKEQGRPLGKLTLDLCCKGPRPASSAAVP